MAKKIKPIYWIIGVIVVLLFIGKSQGLFAVLTVADEDRDYCLSIMATLENENFDCSARRCTVGGDGRYYLWCDCASGYEYVNPGICEPVEIIIECSDSDGGQNKNNKGSVYINDIKQGTDFCLGTSVREFFCDDSDPKGYDDMSMNCDSGYECADGACVREDGNGNGNGNGNGDLNGDGDLNDEEDVEYGYFIKDDKCIKTIDIYLIEYDTLKECTKHLEEPTELIWYKEHQLLLIIGGVVVFFMFMMMMMQSGRRR